MEQVQNQNYPEENSLTSKTFLKVDSNTNSVKQSNNFVSVFKGNIETHFFKLTLTMFSTFTCLPWLSYNACAGSSGSKKQIDDQNKDKH